MGRKPQRSRNPKAIHVITVKVTGAQKNLLIKAAESQGMTLSAFLDWTIFDYCQQSKGLPGGPAPHPKPTPDEYLRSYLLGEKILMPCGKEECNMKIVTFDNAEFCSTCSFRIA